MMDMADWIQYGIDNKYCTEIVCATHDGVPSTEEEDAEWEQGVDCCAPILRLWEPA
jgi:hypothetical protein